MVLEFYRDSHRIFSIFGEIEGRMKFMSDAKDFFAVSSLPLAALQKFNPVRVTIPKDALLLVKSSVLRKFIYPLNCTATMDRYGAALSTSPLVEHGRFRGPIYPVQGRELLEPLLSFDTSIDMFLQFHCRETSLPSSSQLSLLFTNKELLRGTQEFVACMEICQAKDLSTLLRCEPHIIADQESIRQSLIQRCLTLIQRDTTLESFEVEDLYGFSYWTLKK